MTTKLFSVYGRVQGVGFRYFTQREAEKLGVKGYVRNRNDNSVEVVATADYAVMLAFERWLQKGPPTAYVEQLIVGDYLGDEQFERFEIRY